MKFSSSSNDRLFIVIRYLYFLFRKSFEELLRKIVFSCQQAFSIKIEELCYSECSGNGVLTKFILYCDTRVKLERCSLCI
jgi:hypothetical protein